MARPASLFKSHPLVSQIGDYTCRKSERWLGLGAPGDFPLNVQTPPWLQELLFPESYSFASSLLRRHFFLYIDNITTPRTTHFINLERRAQGNSLLLTLLSIFVSS
jgi:hypothetical protein